MARKAHAPLLPQAVRVEPWNVGERVEPTGVAVAREIANRSQPAEDAHARVGPQHPHQPREVDDRLAAEQSKKGITRRVWR